jgi:hypothetical protein
MNQMEGDRRTPRIPEERFKISFQEALRPIDTDKMREGLQLMLDGMGDIHHACGGDGKFEIGEIKSTPQGHHSIEVIFRGHLGNMPAQEISEAVQKVFEGWSRRN